jgi:hypothetical protein
MLICSFLLDARKFSTIKRLMLVPELTARVSSKAETHFTFMTVANDADDDQKKAENEMNSKITYLGFVSKLRPA